jgi:hypothetical protein
VDDEAASLGGTLDADVVDVLEEAPVVSGSGPFGVSFRVDTT